MSIILVVILGLVCGSFINAAVWRLHQQENSTKRSKKNNYSILSGRSMCPNCRHQLAWYDLIPVLSWISLGGKCRYCSQPISLQYPAVELITAGLFTLFYWQWDFAANLSVLAFGLWVGALVSLIMLAVYDLKWMLLPNKLLTILAIVSAALAVVSAIGEGSSGLVWNHLLAALLGAGFFLFFFVVSKGRWMGGGDVKLAAVMGMILGVNYLLVALLLAFNTAALVGIALIASKRLTRKSLLPFGPFLIGATIAALLVGQNIIDWYLSLVGLG